jgi:phage baseplate assembly protein W
MARLRSAAIRIGDTLQSFAARELGDLLRWREVAELNNLAPPWLIPSTREDERIPRVALWGDYLRVPSTATNSSAVVGEDALGADVALHSGRLLLDQGDLAVISGGRNLAQAAGHRIKTPFKTYLPHPDYGCEIHEMLGTPNDDTRNLLSRGLIRRAILRDPRAKDAQVSAQSSGDTLAVTATIGPVESDTPADMNAVFQLPKL